MQSRTVGEKLLRGTEVGVRVEGSQVVLTIGKANVVLPWETAIRLGTYLRYGGKKAKRNANGGPIWTPIADLTYENQDELEAKISVDRKVITARI